MMTVILSFFFLLGGVLSLIFNRKHLLMILLSMELMMLGVFTNLIFNIFNEMYEMVIFFMILIICEACLGLSIMVKMVYFYGVDLIHSYNILNN